MKFYTTQITRSYFDQHIKRDISPKFDYIGDLLDCYVVECLINGYRNGSYGYATRQKTVHFSRLFYNG